MCFPIQIQLGLSVALPVLLLLAGIPLIFVLCRRRHKRRMEELDARERFLHRCCHDDTPGGIHVEHVGEQTLQVKIREQAERAFVLWCDTVF